ncbi:MAG: pyridoxamine 5'-phosphate oxidase [Chitinophagia bacterium]|jgi:pyridoxamine 5'-phosphate oxidase|nr:pyridoxamine 5'-phosphate oxidase [Chitinophagia bacterium]
MNKDIASIRRDYQLATLDESSTSAHPMSQFEHWWEEAIASNIDEVNAFVLSTIDAHRAPASRVVLLKGYTPEGFIFFTNYESNKGLEMEAHPVVALNFFWKELERQVRISGTVKKIATSESEAYFHSRPVSSQIGAWSSPQSKVIPDRTFLENLFETNTQKFASGKVPLPPHWGGYIVHPTQIEFWQGRSSRLHDRIRYTLTNNEWIKERLAP